MRNKALQRKAGGKGCEAARMTAVSTTGLVATRAGAVKAMLGRWNRAEQQPCQAVTNKRQRENVQREEDMHRAEVVREAARQRASRQQATPNHNNVLGHSAVIRYEGHCLDADRKCNHQITYNTTTVKHVLAFDIPVHHRARAHARTHACKQHQHVSSGQRYLQMGKKD